MVVNGGYPLIQDYGGSVIVPQRVAERGWVAPQAFLGVMRVSQRNQSGVQDWDVLEVNRYQTTASTRTWNYDPAVRVAAPPAALQVVHIVGGNCVYYRNSKGWKLAEQDICDQLGRYGALMGGVSFHHVPDPNAPPDHGRSAGPLVCPGSGRVPRGR